MVMELLHDEGYRGNVNFILNVEVDQKRHPFEVEGIHVQSCWYEGFVYGGDACYLGVTQPEVKKILLELYAEKLGLNDHNYPVLSHRTASLASTVKVGSGSHIEALSIVAPYAEIGKFVNIKRGSNVGHHTVIEDFVTLNPGVVVAGNCTIQQGALVGVGTTIFDGVTIGLGSIIGGGSVVTKSIPPGVVAYGNPCKVIRKLS